MYKKPDLNSTQRGSFSKYFSFNCIREINGFYEVYHSYKYNDIEHEEILYVKKSDLSEKPYNELFPD